MEIINRGAYNMSSEILIYQKQEGSIKIDVHLEDENIWLTQEQMVVLFGKGRTTITEHSGCIARRIDAVSFAFVFGKDTSREPDRRARHN